MKKKKTFWATEQKKKIRGQRGFEHRRSEKKKGKEKFSPTGGGRRRKPKGKKEA